VRVRVSVCECVLCVCMCVCGWVDWWSNYRFSELCSRWCM